jgi:hypothetical protein
MLKNYKILLFSNQCAANLKNTTFHRNMKVLFLPANGASQLQPLDLGIIHAFKSHYRKQLIWKTIAVLHVTTQMKPDLLYSMHFRAEAWRLVINYCIVKCAFPNDRSTVNNDCNKIQRR